MGHRRLTHLDADREVADARLTAGVAGHHAQQPQPHRIRQGLELPASSVAASAVSGSRTSGATSQPDTPSTARDFDIHRY